MEIGQRLEDVSYQYHVVNAKLGEITANNPLVTTAGGILVNTAQFRELEEKMLALRKQLDTANFHCGLAFPPLESSLNAFIQELSERRIDRLPETFARFQRDAIEARTKGADVTMPLLVAPPVQPHVPRPRGRPRKHPLPEGYEEAVAKLKARVNAEQRGERPVPQGFEGNAPV